MKVELSEQVVIITGAGRGIGKEVARVSADAGARVVLVARTAEQLEAVAAEIRESGGEALVHACDLSEPGTDKAVVDATLERFGLRLGVALQCLDDLGNLSGGRDPHKRHEDLRLGRCTSGWAWLARHMEQDVFDQLQDESRRVAQDGADPELLAGRMRRLLGEEPARATTHALHDALAELRRALPPESKLTPLRALVGQLEGSYA